jgi:hypothetical protein
MLLIRHEPAPHRVHTVHRVAAGAVGVFLIVFGAIGTFRFPGLITSSGEVVMGMFSNGLLAMLSLAMGVVLTVAATRSGPIASTISVGAGALFVVSGVINMMVVGTAFNLLAFGVANVAFSLVVGVVLLVTGAYGRFTGALPPDSPYATATGPSARSASVDVDVATSRALADAERAVAQHVGTTHQVASVQAASAFRTHEARLRAFVAAG